MNLSAARPLLFLVALATACTVARAANALGADAERLRAELATQQMKADLREFDLKRINSQLADATKRLADTQAALVAKDKEIAALKINTTPTPADSSRASVAEFDQLRRERDQARDTAAGAEIARAELRGQLQQAIVKYAALQTEYAAAQTEKSSLQQQIARLEAGRASEQPQLQQASAQLAAVQAERDALKAQLASSQGEQAAKLAARDRELAALKDADAARAGLVTEKTSLQQQLAKLTASRAEEQRQQQTTADALKARLDATTAQAAAAAKERDALKGQLTVKDKELAAIQAERDRLRKDTAVQQEKMDQLQARLAIAPPATSRAGETDTAAALRQQLAEATGKLDAATREGTLRQAEIDRLQQSLGQLTALAKAVDERTAAGTRAQSDLEVMSAAATRLNNELVTAREQARLAQAAAAAAAAENQSLKTRLVLTDRAAAGSVEPSAFVPSRPPAAVSLPPAPELPATTVAAAAPVAVAEPRIHVVAAGDTLSGVAKKYYGNASRWSAILDANRAAIKNADVLTVGTRLKIP
ncbi:MAG: LysM peptidoglycan-binding domain-containing protein [Verrucomicrobiota bacterium]